MYFKQNILENLTQPSLIILDRASYHVTYDDDEFFPTRAKKQQLKDWLIAHDISFDETAPKQDLKILALSHWEYPQNKIEILAKQDGLNRFRYPHKVLYLPPYHPEYNEIEFAWARIKHHLGAYPTYNIEDIQNETLPRALLEVDPAIAVHTVHHVIDRWKQDAEDEIDPIEIAHRIQVNRDFNI